MARSVLCKACGGVHDPMKKCPPGDTQRVTPGHLLPVGQRSQGRPQKASQRVYDGDNEFITIKRDREKYNAYMREYRQRVKLKKPKESGP